MNRLPFRQSGRRPGAAALIAAAFCLWLMLAGPLPARALEVSRASTQSGEILDLDFGGAAPGVSASRTGRNEVTLTLQPGALGKGAPVSFPEGLVRSVTPRGDTLVIGLSTDGFGYINLPGRSEGSLRLQFFRDPLGSRWQPSGKSAATAAKPAALEKNAAPKPTQPASAAKAAPGRAGEGLKAGPKAPQAAPAPERNTAKAQPAPEKAPRASAAAPSQPPAASTPQTVPAEPGQGGQAAPGNTLRQPAAPVPPPSSPQSRPLAPAPVQAAPSGEVRMKASPRTLDQMLADAASRGNVLPSAPIPGQPPAPAQAPAPNAALQPQDGMQPEVKAPDQPAPSARPPQTEPARPAPAPAPASLPSVPAEALPHAAPAAPEPLVRDEAAPPAEGHAAQEQAPPAGSAPEHGQPVPANGEEIKLGEDGHGTPKAEGAHGEAKPAASAEELLLAAQQAYSQGSFDKARETLNGLLALPHLDQAIREEALYMLAEAVRRKHQDDLKGHFDEIVGAYERAMNTNSTSTYIPNALLNLGLVNLKVGNIPESNAYFNLLTRKYPENRNIPYVSFYQGNYHEEKGNLQKAAEYYQHVVQNWPDSAVVRDAALGLARTLHKLGYDAQGAQIVDYMDKRWPRFYVDSPDFLRLSGDISMNLNQNGPARDDYWALVNLYPDRPDADVVLARIGDGYLRDGKAQAATDVYKVVADKYPEAEGGLVARMRLAEQGIYDDPALGQMFAAFDKPDRPDPEEIYTDIIEGHPDSRLAPLARLKLAMWRLWNKDYAGALTAVADLLETQPEQKIADRALEVGLSAFADAAGVMSGLENYGRIGDLWDRFPFLAAHESGISPATRVQTARALGRLGRAAEALAILEPFLGRSKDSDQAEPALAAALEIRSAEKDWKGIVELTDRTKGWQLPPALALERDYDRALALSSLDREADARDLWTALSASRELAPERRARALLHMAGYASAENRLKNEYLNAEEALSLFLQYDPDPTLVRESLSRLMEVMERTGRYTDALAWAMEYDKRVSPEDPEWPAFRYRLARIHRQLGDVESWRAVLTDLTEKRPDTLYARTAASDLKAHELESAARAYGAGSQP